MITPAIRAWAEEANGCTRQGEEGSNVAPFVPVADEAGEGEVLLGGRPAMFLADDVVYLAPEEGVCFVDEAVLTEALGPVADEPP